MIAFRDPARSRRLAVEHRDEGGGKGALGNEGAEHVGQAEGDPVEGVRREARPRSEEHTSELQSLMRISYAVFCLKKKTILTNSHTNAWCLYSVTCHRRN